MYYLIVGNAKKGTIIDFSKIPEYKNLNSHRLKDIVAFTNSFETEQELVLYLKYHGIIDKHDDNLTFGIYKKYGKSKPEKLNFGISLKKDTRYFNVETLTNYILGNIRDFKFFSAFINRYYSIYNAKKDRLSTFDALHSMPGIYSRYIYYVNNGRMLTETRELISDFIKKYTKDYPNLRDMAMFVIEYRNKLHHVKNNLETIKELKEELNHFKEILQNESITEEQRLAYTEKIKNIENDIEMRYGR